MTNGDLSDFLVREQPRFDIGLYYTAQELRQQAYERGFWLEAACTRRFVKRWPHATRRTP